MKVILTQNIKGVGHTDDIVNVSDGYARNYLFPRKLALPANEVNLKQIEKRKQVEEDRGEKAVEESKDLAEQINEAQITVKGRVGTGTKLYGSITHADITDALEQQTGIKIDKRKIEMEEPIKSLGTYEVPIRLHKDAVAHIKVEVVGEEE